MNIFFLMYLAIELWFCSASVENLLTRGGFDTLADKLLGYNISWQVSKKESDSSNSNLE